MNSLLTTLAMSLDHDFFFQRDLNPRRTGYAYGHDFSLIPYAIYNFCHIIYGVLFSLDVKTNI